MALDKTRMATNIADKLIAAGIIDGGQKPSVIVIWEEICDGLIDEITANAVVATTVTAEYLNPADVTGTGSGGVT